MRHKLRDWTKRYFPAEIVGTITALIASTLAFILTGNYIVTAFAPEPGVLWLYIHKRHSVKPEVSQIKKQKIRHKIIFKKYQKFIS